MSFSFKQRCYFYRNIFYTVYPSRWGLNCLLDPAEIRRESQLGESSRRLILLSLNFSSQLSIEERRESEELPCLIIRSRDQKDTCLVSLFVFLHLQHYPWHPESSHPNPLIARESFSELMKCFDSLQELGFFVPSRTGPLQLITIFHVVKIATLTTWPQTIILKSLPQLAKIPVKLIQQ